MYIENEQKKDKIQASSQSEALKKEFSNERIVELTDDQLQSASGAGTPDDHWKAQPPWLDPRHERPRSDPNRLLPDLPT